MDELRRYTKAMIAGNTSACINIELRHDLFGYPPELVSIGLKAVDEGLSPHDAIEAYIAGTDVANEQEPQP